MPASKLNMNLVCHIHCTTELETNNWYNNNNVNYWQLNKRMGYFQVYSESRLEGNCNILSDESRFAIDSDTLFACFLVNSWTTTFSSSSRLLPHGSCPLKHNNVNQTITEPEVVITEMKLFYFLRLLAMQGQIGMITRVVLASTWMFSLILR